MIQVEHVTAEVEDFDTILNEILAELFDSGAAKEIIDIKYSMASSAGELTYGALIIYEWKENSSYNRNKPKLYRLEFKRRC